MKIKFIHNSQLLIIHQIWFPFSFLPQKRETEKDDKPVETYQCSLHINTHCCVSKRQILETQQLHIVYFMV